MRVLAGDIGGTKTALALVDFSARGLSFERVERYASAAYASLEPIVEETACQCYGDETCTFVVSWER